MISVIFFRKLPAELYLLRICHKFAPIFYFLVCSTTEFLYDSPERAPTIDELWLGPASSALPSPAPEIEII